MMPTKGKTMKTINAYDTTAQHGPGFAITSEWTDGKVAKLARPAVGPTGYDGAVGIHAMPHAFRLLDDDGEVMAVGICNEGALEDDLNPLFCYGGMFGCTMMEIRENGEWVAHIG